MTTSTKSTIRTLLRPCILLLPLVWLEETAGAAFTTTFSSGSRVPSRADSSSNSEQATTNTVLVETGDVDRNSQERRNSNIISTPTPRVHNVQFISPLLEYGYRPAVEEFENEQLCNKPLFLYLPGFDGTFLSPFLQFPELHTIFDVRCMTIGMDDRSTLEELRDGVVAYLLQECCYLEKERHQLEIIDSNESLLPDRTISNSREPPAGGGRFMGLFPTTNNNKSDVAKTKNGTSKSDPKRQRDVYLVGESFGGILASEVALLLKKENLSVPLKGLTLINAATCYDRSKLAREAPKLCELNSWIYPAGLLQLLPIFADEHSFEQLLLILQSKALPSIIDDASREAYMGRVAFSLPFALKFMPQDTLRWRLSEWLETGCARLATPDNPLSRLKSLRTLIIAGEKDLTLPSIAEAERLTGILTNSLVHVVDGAGHASTCGSRVDLAALFRAAFKELRPLPMGNRNRRQRDASSNSCRMAMKEEASKGKGPYFGMEPRYDSAKIGLNPLLYWSKKHYRRYKSQR